MRSRRVSCLDCPAWDPIKRNGSEVCIPEVGENGQPKVIEGVVQYVKDESGRMVTKGFCSLYAPKIIVGPQGQIMTWFPETCSNWFCEDPAKHALLKSAPKARS